jgi:hypothetical protein
MYSLVRHTTNLIFVGKNQQVSVRGGLTAVLGKKKEKGLFSEGYATALREKFPGGEETSIKNLVDNHEVLLTLPTKRLLALPYEEKIKYIRGPVSQIRIQTMIKEGANIKAVELAGGEVYLDPDFRKAILYSRCRSNIDCPSMARRMNPKRIFLDDEQAQFFFEQFMPEWKISEADRAWMLDFTCNDIVKGRENHSPYLRGQGYYGQPSISNLHESLSMHHFLTLQNIQVPISQHTFAYRSSNKPTSALEPSKMRAITPSQKFPDCHIDSPTSNVSLVTDIHTLMVSSPLIPSKSKRKGYLECSDLDFQTYKRFLSQNELAHSVITSLARKHSLTYDAAIVRYQHVIDKLKPITDGITDENRTARFFQIRAEWPELCKIVPELAVLPNAPLIITRVEWNSDSSLITGLRNGYNNNPHTAVMDNAAESAMVKFNNRVLTLEEADSLIKAISPSNPTTEDLYQAAEVADPTL